MTNGRRRSVYLSDEQWRDLGRIAKSEDRSINSVVRRFVTVGLAGPLEPDAIVEAVVDHLARQSGRLALREPR